MDCTGSSPYDFCSLSHVRELVGTLLGTPSYAASIPTAPLSFTELMVKLIQLGILSPCRLPSSN